MSRRHIERHIAAAGWTLDELDYEPELGSGDGPNPDSWHGVVSQGDREVEIYGYNWREVIATFDRAVAPREDRDDG